MCNVDWWIRGRVLVQHSLAADSISSRGDYGVILLMRPNKVEAAAQCFRMSRAQVIAGFSRSDDSIHIIRRYFEIIKTKTEWIIYLKKNLRPHLTHVYVPLLSCSIIIHAFISLYCLSTYHFPWQDVYSLIY